MLTRNFDLSKLEDLTSDELIVFIDEGNFVNFIAWHKDSSELFYFQNESVEFPNFDIARAYVSDMTLDTAKAVINNFSF